MVLIMNSDIQSTTITAPSSKNENDDEKVSTLSPDVYSDNNINSPRSIIESNTQYAHGEINENGEGSDLEMEDLLLGIKDREGNFVWNDDEYDLTEEEEKFLLYNDCSENYVRNMSVRDVIKFHNIDDEGHSLTINATTPELNQYDQSFRSNDTKSSSNNCCNDASEDENLDTSNVKKSDDYLIFSITPTAHIKFKGLHINSEIKLNDKMKTQENVVDSASDENVLGSDDAEVSNNNENDGDITGKFHNKSYSEPVEVNLIQNTYLSPKKMPMNISTPKDDENYSNHETLAEERISPEISNGEFNLSKIMKSETSRRCYFSLLKERTQSLLISYTKYKSAYLQCPSKFIDELNPTKTEKSITTNLFQQSKKNETELLEDNKVISFFDIQPLIGFFDRVCNEATTQSFIVQQSQDQIRNEHLFEIYPKADDKKVKNTASKTLVEEEIARNTVGLVCNKARKGANETLHTFPRIKYTEILNKFPFENIDLQAKNHDLNTVPCSSCKNNTCGTEENEVPLSTENFHKKRTRGRILKLKTNFSTQTLHNLFCLNNKIAIDIMSVLVNKQYKTGASLLDIMKHLRRDIKTKLRQDISNFLNAAVDVGIIQMKYKRYILPKRKVITNRIHAVQIVSNDGKKTVINKILSRRIKTNKQKYIS